MDLRARLNSTSPWANYEPCSEFTSLELPVHATWQCTQVWKAYCPQKRTETCGTAAGKYSPHWILGMGAGNLRSVECARDAQRTRYW